MAAQNGCTCLISSTTAETWSGVMVGTLPTSSPVAGLKLSSVPVGAVASLNACLGAEGAMVGSITPIYPRIANGKAASMPLSPLRLLLHGVLDLFLDAVAAVTVAVCHDTDHL